MLPTAWRGLRATGKICPRPEEGFRRSDYLYVIDPSGLMMMRFPPTADIYAVRRDLKKLLKLSQVRRSVRQTSPQ